MEAEIVEWGGYECSLVRLTQGTFTAWTASIRRIRAGSFSLMPAEYQAISEPAIDRRRGFPDRTSARTWLEARVCELRAEDELRSVGEMDAGDLCAGLHSHRLIGASIVG